MKRATLLAIVGVGVACQPSPDGPSPQAPKPPAPSPWRVLVTGDVGGQLAPVHDAGGLAAQVAAFRARSGPETVVLDAGDRFFRAYRVPVPHRPRAERAADALAQALLRTGAQAMVVGERDLALGLRPLRRLAARGGVELVSANLRHTRSGTAAFATFSLARRAGATLGVVGVSPAFGAEDPRAEAYTWAGLRAEPPGPSLARAVARARAAGAQRVVALLHIERAEAEAALAGTNVDLAVLAHPRGTAEVLPPVGMTALASLSDRNRGFVEAEIAARGRPEAQLRRVGAASTPDEATLAAVAGVDRPRPSSARYVGSRACATECHAPALKHWRGTPHAKAFRHLVTERQSTNRDCLPCHTVGFARPGGPSKLGPRLTKYRNVGCESCHGPAQAHRSAPEQHRAGPVDPMMCAECHRTQAYQRAFELDARWATVLGLGHGVDAESTEAPASPP